MRHLIVLGAGASFDFVSREKVADPILWSRFYPPLSRDILNTALYEEKMRKFPLVSNLAAGVLNALAAGKDLEEFMFQLKERGGHRIPELIAFQFYLQELFRHISEVWFHQPGDNYRDLIGRIYDSGGEATVVTFNYDSIFESRLPNLANPENLNAYINGGIKVVKMHGSHNWNYVWNAYNAERMKEVEDCSGIYGYLTEHPDKAFGFGTTKEVPEILTKPWDRDPGPEGRIYGYPALAVPMHIKHTFICPESHVNEIKKTLEQTQKILIIGWKAGDEKFLDLLAANIMFPVEFTLVVGNLKNSLEVEAKIKSKISPGLVKVVSTGKYFSEFMASDECDKFFS